MLNHNNCSGRFHKRKNKPYDKYVFNLGLPQTVCSSYYRIDGITYNITVQILDMLTMLPLTAIKSKRASVRARCDALIIRGKSASGLRNVCYRGERIS